MSADCKVVGATEVANGESARAVWERAARALKFVVVASFLVAATVSLLLAGSASLLWPVGGGYGKLARMSLLPLASVAFATPVPVFLQGLGQVLLVLPIRSLAAARRRTPLLALELPMYCAAILAGIDTCYEDIDLLMPKLVLLAAPFLLAGFFWAVSLPITLRRRLLAREGAPGPVTSLYAAVPDVAWALLPLLLVAGLWLGRVGELGALVAERSRLEAELAPLRSAQEQDEERRRLRRELSERIQFVWRLKELQAERAAGVRVVELFRLLPRDLPVEHLELSARAARFQLRLPASARSESSRLEAELRREAAVSSLVFRERESGELDLELDLELEAQPAGRRSGDGH